MKNEFGALMLWIDRKLNRNQDVLVTKIDSIKNLFETSAEATASSADILEGKTAYNGTTLITGTMENQGAKEATLLAGGIYNIPRGWHDGAGRVTATDLDSQTPGTATAGGILSGLKAWVAGQLINGVMKDRRGVTVTAGAVTQDDEYTYLTVPEEACFNANSKLRTKNSNIANVKKYTYPIKYLAAGASVEMIYPKSAIAVYIGAQEGFSAGCACLILCDGTKCGYAIEATVISETVVKFTNPSGTYGKAHNFEYGYFYI